MLSVLLVTLDAMPHLPRAIEQAEACRQTHGAEVVAVDGGSTDGTWEALTARSGWVVHRQRDSGLAAARNEAVRLARGEVLAFLDADDEWLPGKTARQLDLLAAQPRIDLVSAHLRKVGPAGDGTVHAGWTPSCCMVRRRAFARVGPFDRNLRIACDHAWFMRARRLGLRTHLIDDCLVLKHLHGRNLSNRRAEYRAELLRLLRADG